MNDLLDRIGELPGRALALLAGDPILALQWLTAAAFVIVGVATVRDYLAHRTRQRLFLALALGQLGGVSLIGQLTPVIPRSLLGIVTAFNIIAFQGSAYALLQFRHSFIPLSARARAAGAIVLFGSAALFLVAGLVEPPKDPRHPGSLYAAATIALILTWCVSVAEPTVRFFFASRRRPAVQRRRLRALSTGYLGIIFILVLAVAAPGLFNNPSNRLPQVVIQLMALATAPLMYVSFAPPRWLRRLWREPEEEAYREAVNELLLFAPDRATLAQRGLEWALRLVGADAGIIVDGDGTTLASRGLDAAGSDRLATMTTRALPEGVVADGDASSVIVLPLHVDTGAGRMVISSGPFSPIFGSEEVSRLRQYAAAVTAGLDRARLSERMVALEEVKSRFLKLASHELRGPLSLVNGYISMVQDGSCTTEEFIHVIPTIRGKLNQMTLMLNEMLETARLEDDRLQLRPERFDLRTAATAVLEAMRPLAGERHQLELVVPRKEIAVLADRARVETILTNLVENAIKYSPDGGRVRCELRANGTMALASVHDRGIGIEADALTGLFTRFGRVMTPETASIPGTGLGLYLSRELARLQQGEITAESEPGRGSTFTLQLPLAGVSSVGETLPQDPHQV